MKIRIDARMIFDPAETGAWHAVQAVLKAQQNKALNVSDTEKSFITIQECKHDEVPSGPCVVVYQWTKE